MTVAGVAVRTVLAIVVVALSILAVAAFLGHRPLSQPLLWGAMAWGAVSGIVGSAVETWFAAWLNPPLRLLTWAAITALAMAPVTLFYPHLPVGWGGATLIGILTGFFEAIVPSSLTTQ